MGNKGRGGHNHTIVDRTCLCCGSVFKGPERRKFCTRICANRFDYSKKMLLPYFRLNQLLSGAKNRAKSKAVAFNLDKHYLQELWDQNNATCQISGIPFDLTRAKKGTVHPYAPSIDRIEPQLGYIKGNVRLIVYQMNVALSEFGLEQFNSFIRDFISNTNFR